MNLIPGHVLDDFVKGCLKEDCPNFEVTCAILPDIHVTAHILGKSSGVLCGRPFVQAIFDRLGCSVEWRLDEGSPFDPVYVIAVVTGRADKVLIGERIALNILARASGIATRYRRIYFKFSIFRCRRLSEMLVSGTKLAGTRKTTPYFRLVEKYAMVVGGCDPHRYDLSSLPMIKDNHIDILGKYKAKKCP